LGNCKLLEMAKGKGDCRWFDVFKLITIHNNLFIFLKSYDM
jgi:hypothetical protein